MWRVFWERQGGAEGVVSHDRASGGAWPAIIVVLRGPIGVDCAGSGDCVACVAVVVTGVVCTDGVVRLVMCRV